MKEIVAFLAHGKTLSMSKCRIKWVLQGYKQLLFYVM
jgi:hypothetical protein